MLYHSKGNKWSIPSVLNEIDGKSKIEFLYRDKLGRFRKQKQLKKLWFKTLLRCGTKCTHCGKEGLHFELDSNYKLKLVTVDGIINVEHIIPQSLGGTDINYNITSFCDICNTAKGNGLLVPTVGKNKPTVSKNKPIVIKFGKWLTKYMKSKPEYSRICMNKLMADAFNCPDSKYNLVISHKHLTKYCKKINTYFTKNHINLSITKEYVLQNL